MDSRIIQFGLGLLALGAMVGCDQNMIDQPRYEPLEASEFFQDGQSSRPIISGTVARGKLKVDEEFFTGRVDGEPVRGLPDRALDGKTMKELLARGQERYQIFCMPCHGISGNADGMVVKRGFPRPPSFVSGDDGERLRGVGEGHFFGVITNGIGRMYPYASQIPPDDRWAIAAYIRALQLSHHASVDALPADLKDKLQSAPESKE
ncbi:c-type cytochrome [Thalassoroseus pseudoceratinae]|uniref:c-type cytochrome n=1 Tax=Thalassoroseus pseudoceratinae TaxID=2713176 RepID=UPI00142187DB|nr:cytochrome c [Thalassoroseus pseudoceratinae]